MEQMQLNAVRPWYRRRISISGAFCIAIVCAGGAFVAGSIFGDSFRAPPPAVYDVRAPEEADLAPLFAAWQLLNQHFAPATSTVATPEEKVWGAIKGLTAAYGDDYTVFLPPAEKEIFQTQVNGDFQGVGMEIGKRNGLLTVIAPIKDTPAYRAGIEPGDIILEIDGAPTTDLTVEGAVSKIRGPKGTTVVLSISRSNKNNGKAFDIPVVRDVIILPTGSYALKDGVFVIELYMFNGQAPRVFAEALAAFDASGTSKLVIDLRGNPGGFLEVAVDLASRFVKSGEIIVSQDYAGAEPIVYRSSGIGSLYPETDIVILLNEGSASASEIFAGALRDYGRATLIGQQSFGKGSVQQVFDVTDTTSLKITIARWLTPKGVSISHEGLKPDIEVKLPEEVLEGSDPTFERAVQFLKTGK